MSDRIIHRKLEQVRRLERAIWLTRALAMIVVYAALAGACHFALDWTFRPQTAGRLVLLAGFLAALAYGFWREVWMPLRTFPSRDRIALAVERHFPDLRGRFISAWQLSRVLYGPTTAAVEGYGSTDLIAELIRDTVGAIANLNFRAVPERKSRNRGLALAAAALLLWAAFVGLTTTGRLCFPVWLQRLARPTTVIPYPTKTLAVLNEADRFRRVARGEDIELRARAQGLIPASGAIRIQRGQGKWLEQPVTGAGRDFVFVHKAVMESFDYYWRLGDGESEKARVEVVIPPQVRGISARYEFPAYTRRPPETASGGNLEALPGTRVALFIQTNKPIARGALMMEDGRQLPLVPQPPAPAPSTTSTLSISSISTYTVTLDVPTSRSAYRIRLIDEFGFENRDPMEYAIQPVADEPPRVEIRDLDERKYVTPYATLPLEIHVRDDYGLTRVQLHLSIAGAKEETIEVAVRPNGINQTVMHTLALEPYELKPGVEAILWASAYDNREIGGPQVGLSPRTRLEVVSPEEMIRIMRERMESLVPRLEQIGLDTLDSRTKIEDLLKSEDRETSPAKQR
ncbi:MAG: hypothetical protein N3D11_10410 [Candidatus Sumerlaeia bacterium]|nr:hypothetical protein [Candidatus Sumerlaeia bacterium]